MVVFIKDNVFDKRKRDYIAVEIAQRIPDCKDLFYDRVMLHRVSFDQFYSNRTKSPCLSFIDRIFKQDIIPEIDEIEEFAFRRMLFPFTYYTFLTLFREEGRQVDWHRDTCVNQERFFMSWIYYINNDFDGGVLHYMDKGKEIEIQPKPNRLVLIPGHIDHMVSACHYGKGQNVRTTINGFFEM